MYWCLREREVNNEGYREVLGVQKEQKWTRVVSARGNSALMLVAARLRHLAGKWGLKRYLKMETGTGISNCLD